MKAVIRGKGETVTESMQIEGIDWNTGFPLTQKDWPGGAYTLVENYTPLETETDGLRNDVYAVDVPSADPEESTVVEEKEVTAPQTYTLSEAKRLLGLE